MCGVLAYSSLVHDDPGIGRQFAPGLAAPAIPGRMRMPFSPSPGSGLAGAGAPLPSNPTTRRNTRPLRGG